MRKSEVFFPTAEGYVKSIIDSQDLSGIPIYSYVYNYTNYLGNIRLSYSPTKWEFGAPDTGFKANLKVGFNL